MAPRDRKPRTAPSSQLSAHPALLQTFLNALPQAVIATDGTGHVTFVNHAAEHLLGISARQLAGRELPFAELARLADIAMANQAAVKHHGVELVSGQQQKIIVDIQAAPILAPLQVEPDGVILTIEDQGVMSKLHQHSIQREAIRSAGVMAAMLAHEVKNPLSGIKGAAQLLEQQLDPSQRKLAGLICSEVDRIKTLVNQIEFLSSPLVVETSPVNIHEVLQYVKELAEKGVAAHVHFTERYDPSLPQVAGNRELLIQLFLNLVKNAAEALAGTENATITLSTRYDRSYRFAAKGNKTMGLPICVTVQDNGPGIPPEQQETIFDPFVTTKTDGKGLGLTIVSKITADHGGIIELDKQVTEGAGFTVMLPYYR